MRYAIVSDLHANLRAWNAVLADLCEQGAEIVICLGDVVGYGPNPAEVLESVRAVTSNIVMGNHDAAAVGMMDYSIFNDHARQAIEWTMTALSDEEKQFLSSVPLAIEAGEVLFVHAEIAEPGRFAYISDATIAQQNLATNSHLVTFVGHTHLPKIFERDSVGDVRELADHDALLDPNKRYIVNVGSVGEPRDPDDLRARYVLYDPERREVIFRRVNFDIAAYRNDLEATTLALRPFFLRVYEQVVEGRNVNVSHGGSLVDMHVSSDSAALVDLGQVASLAHLHNSGELPRSGHRSWLPIVILAAAAILILGFLALRLFPDREAADPAPPLVEAEKPIAKEQNPTPPREPSPPPAEPKREGPAEIARVPDRPEPDPTPAKPKPAPVIPDPEPEPTQVVPPVPAQVYWWRMGDLSKSTALIEAKNTLTLVPVEEGKALPPLAPDPIPGNQVTNRAARKLGIWREQNSANHFAMTAQESFTFEGWFVVRDFRKTIVLFGTRSDGEDGRGWHLDLRPQSRGQRGQSMTFFHDSGTSQTVAFADGLTLDEAPAHHFAIVWDHDAKAAAGEMQVYLDGKSVARASLPHADLLGKQVNPLQVGASLNSNAANIGLDELRFTRRSLEPHELLVRAPVTGITLIQSDGRSTDSWAVPGNWEGGRIPGGSDNVIIGPGLQAQIKSASPKPFTGQLVLKKEASLQLWTKASEAVLPKVDGKSRLIMFANSRLILRAKESSDLGPIELVEPAHIFGGLSTSGHHAVRRFTGEISGPGQLIINGVNGNAFRFESPATYSGGTITKSRGSQPFHLVGVVDGCFGSGPVEVQDFASLRIRKNSKDTIADYAALILTGPKGNLDRKLMMETDETVARLIVDGVDLGEGVYSARTHPDIIGGSGKLIVRTID